MLRYAITDRRRLGATEGERTQRLIENAERWVADGIDYIQLREKDLAPGRLAALARGMKAALTRAGAPKLLINSRADIAVATGADGVHLTSAAGQLTPAEIRQVYASAGLAEPIVSVSCHSLAEVSMARESGATLILFGPVFEKVIGQEGLGRPASQVESGSGLYQLSAACTAAAPVPLLALGGVTDGNTAACLQAGAAGIAAIRLFLG